MKFIAAISITIIVNFLLSLFLPWWIIAVGAGLVAYLLPQLPWKSSLAGFMAGFIHWSGLAFFVDVRNDHILATRIAAVFSVGHPASMILIAGVIAALVTGLAALSAVLLRQNRSLNKPAA